MAVVLLRPTAGPDPAAVHRVLSAAGLASRTIVLANGGGAASAVPSGADGLSGVDGLIVLGGPGSDPALAAEALVREALAAEVPVLALGTGARLLARAAGAPPTDPAAPARAPARAGTSPAGTAARGAAARRPARGLTSAAGGDPVFAGAARP
ncbi:hypothetical protein ACFXA3_35755, partial [Streptomyces sp. NPDC059456]